MNNRRLINFADRADIEKQFETKLDDDIEILLAWYGYGDYEGDAFVLFRKDGKLYEVNGGHCSCNGLEGQWDPEETSIEALRFQLDKGTRFSDYYDGYQQAKEELTAVLEELDGTTS